MVVLLLSSVFQFLVTVIHQDSWCQGLHLHLPPPPPSSSTQIDELIRYCDGISPLDLLPEAVHFSKMINPDWKGEEEIMCCPNVYFNMSKGGEILYIRQLGSEERALRLVTDIEGLLRSGTFNQTQTADSLNLDKKRALRLLEVLRNEKNSSL